MEDDETNKPIFSSCLKYHNFIELFELIDKIGFDSFDKFDTLRMFINYDHTIFTKFYFTNKNDPMIKDKKYYSNISILIQKVIKNGNVEIFDLFINDFDVNNKLFNEENETALHVAVKCGKYDIVKYLLEKKLNVNVNEFIYGGGGHGYGGDGIGNGQKNALHIAIQNEDVKIVDLLLKNDKINVNKKFINEIINNNRINFDVKELTPLYMAVITQNYEIVQLLLSHKGIDVLLQLQP